MVDDVPTEFAFAGRVIEWRGPAPFYFVRLQAGDASGLRVAATRSSYGWGCVPIDATIGRTEFRTSLFPKAGGYLLPLKAAVRRTLLVAPGDLVEARIRIVPARRMDHPG